MTITVWPPSAWLYGALAATLLLTAAAFVLGRRRRMALKPSTTKTPTSKGDLLAAAIATAVSAEGMWQTFEALDVPIWLRAVTFAFIEVNVVQCARRARQTMQRKLAEIAAGKSWEKASSGVDGIAMWVLTCVSAGLSVAHELTVADPNLAVVLVRLVAPLVAAWGWERHMALERHARGMRKAINWTWTLERLAVRLGVAEPAERSATEVDVARRLHRVAVATAQHEAIRSGGWHLPWAERRAWSRQKDRMREALEHTDLAHDSELQARLEAETAVLVQVASFGAMPRRPFWMPAPPKRGGEPVRICVGRTGLLHVRGYGPGDAELAREASRLKESVRRLRTLGRGAYGAGAGAVEAARTAPVRELPVRAHLEPVRTVEDVSRTEPRTGGGAGETVPVEPAAPARTSRARTGRVTAARTARTEVKADVRKPRGHWAPIIAEEIRTARTAGRTWEPDYDDLEARTGWRRSWCEKTVRDAKAAADVDPQDGRTGRTGTSA